MSFWPGLRNSPGNICFLNSVLQSLRGCRSFVSYVSSDASLPATSLSAQLATTLSKLGCKSKVPVALDAKQVLHAPGMPAVFQSREQQDAQELYTALLDVLDKEIAYRVRPVLPPGGAVTSPERRLLRVDRGRNSPSRTVYKASSRKNPFVGLLASTVKCGACDSVCSMSYSEFSSLSLFIPSGEGKVTLEDCLEHYTTTELVPDYECENCCQKGSVRKRVLIGRLPQALCLHLQRSVSGNDFGGVAGKISSHVNFPDHLDLSGFLPNAHPGFFSPPGKEELTTESLLPMLSPAPLSGSVRGGNADDMRQSPLRALSVSPRPADASADYHLSAVIVHHGHGAEQGHFTAFRRNGNDIGWVRFNDEKSSSVTLKTVLAANAYMLFYETDPTATTTSLKK